ncbi:hypothetical protein [Noviherbaspirillum sp. Root189]|uniref:hypothetical protein n=1 Tax=Noviherbaspirillum sp. Root189 TaxID=1736487 RepID=UPI0012E3B685|nr:hypothetical protein [Noviherbaspirillum sp. Root189]
MAAGMSSSMAGIAAGMAANVADMVTGARPVSETQVFECCRELRPASNPSL